MDRLEVMAAALYRAGTRRQLVRVERFDVREGVAEFVTRPRRRWRLWK